LIEDSQQFATCSTSNSFTSKLGPQQSKDEAFLGDLGVLGGEMF